MRADRLVSLVLLLRQRGLTSATDLASELEVSRRTVLRDLEALSLAGVPVYAERGRHGGFALLPGFRTELTALTGLSDDEALALLSVAAPRGGALGLGPALASARRKVVDALPTGRRAVDDARRLLVEPADDLLARRQPVEAADPAVVASVRRAVLDGRRLRIHYAARGREAEWRTVDPVGLVTVRDRAYLLALRSGQDRSYRLSRIIDATVLPEPADRPEGVDLGALWAERCARFLSEDHVTVEVLVEADRREDLLDLAEAVRAEETRADGRLLLDVTFQDLWHAEWALWQLGAAAEALRPPALRAALHARATRLARRYADPVSRSGPRTP